MCICTLWHWVEHVQIPYQTETWTAWNARSEAGPVRVTSRAPKRNELVQPPAVHVGKLKGSWWRKRACMTSKSLSILHPVYTNGCFLKCWYPQIIHFKMVFHYKRSILGYPYFWKHRNIAGWLWQLSTSNPKALQILGRYQFMKSTEVFGNAQQAQLAFESPFMFGSGRHSISTVQTESISLGVEPLGRKDLRTLGWSLVHTSEPVPRTESNLTSKNGKKGERRQVSDIGINFSRPYVHYGTWW